MLCIACISWSPKTGTTLRGTSPGKKRYNLVRTAAHLGNRAAGLDLGNARAGRANPLSLLTAVKKTTISGRAEASSELEINGVMPLERIWIQVAFR